MKSKTETPTETITKKLQDTATATDARGRTIVVNRLNALQYYRLTKAMGQTASNPATMDLAVIASSVRKIDLIDFATPLTERDVELLMQELDFDGLTAAGEALKQLGTHSDDGTEAAKN